MPPNEYRIISKGDLRRKWFDENWPEHIAQYHCDTWTFAISTLFIWRDGEDIMAVVKEYHQRGRSPETVVRQLRDGNIMYMIP